MTLATALRRKFLSPAPHPFTASHEGTDRMQQQQEKKSILYHISPQGSQSPTGAVLRRTEGRPGWSCDSSHLLEDGSHPNPTKLLFYKLWASGTQRPVSTFQTPMPSHRSLLKCIDQDRFLDFWKDKTGGSQVVPYQRAFQRVMWRVLKKREQIHLSLCRAAPCLWLKDS